MAIGIGIIGAGSMGSSHARTLATDLGDRARIAAVAEVDPALRERFTGRYGGAGYASYEQLLADPAVAAVCICLPHHLHADCAVAAAAAGKHLLVEKPLATTLEACDRMIAAARAAGVVLMAGHIMQFTPSYLIAREILDAGTVGHPVLATGTMSKAWAFDRRREWHKDRARGGGMWLTNGVHVVDRLSWLIGSEVVAVKATVGTRLHDQPADDVALAHLEYRNGVHAVAITVGYADGAPKHTDELTCARGMLNVSIDGVWLGRREAWEEIDWRARWPAEEWRWPAQANEWRAFLDAIEGRTPSPVTGEYARHVVEVLLAAEQSSASGREVRLAGMASAVAS